MPRKPRIEFEGALYHVITRGNQRQETFKEEDDYRRYLRILAHYKERHRFYLYAYILMKNHVHLVMETREVPLSKILQGINQSYTMYFNRKYHTVGHLFQGRYKAILCDKDEYLFALVKYVHLNPVRAGLVEDPTAYRWSSHQSYLSREDDELVDTAQVLDMFLEDKARARKRYKVFMHNAQNVTKEDVYRIVDQRILGSGRFVQTVNKKTERTIALEKKRHEFSLDAIAEGIKVVFGITLKQLRGKGKNRPLLWGKKLMSFVAREYGYKGREIADYLHKDPAVITRYLREKESFKTEMGKVFTTLEEGKSNVNRQV
jgi:putative transposase